MSKKSAAQPLKIPEDALAELFLELWQYDQESPRGRQRHYEMLEEGFAQKSSQVSLTCYLK